MVQSTSFGPQRALSTSAEGASSVYATDLDGDGDVDVLSASQFDNTIAWYENLGGGSFGPSQAITTSVTFARSVYATDLDGDGDADVLSASTSDDEVAWYENRGGGSFGSKQVITPSADGAASVYATDLDGDGDADVLSGSVIDDKVAWYENLGGGSFGPQQVITTSVDSPLSVYATDLDGDGDADVLSASATDDRIAWYENLGGGSFGGVRTITTSADSAESVYATDLDGDGDADVLSASRRDNKIAWYENLGGGSFGPEETITNSARDAKFVYATDLDGDGDADVLSASALDNKIAWYENLGSGSGGGLIGGGSSVAFGPQHIITTLAYAANSVYAADLDGDGDADVLSTSSIDNKVATYENGVAPNDECSDALQLVSGMFVSFSTTFATYSADAPARSCGGAVDPLDVWYVFTPYSSGPASVSTCDLADFDTTLEVYSGDCGALVSVGCNDNFSGCNGFTSQVDFTATAFTTYYVRLAGRGDGTGTGGIMATYPTAPSNEDCSTARPIGIGETPYSNVGAGDSGVAMSCVEDGETTDVWFSYTAIGDCLVTIDLAGSNFDTGAAVYSGDCGALTQVDCNDDGGPVSGITSFLSFTATAGTTYSIQVGGLGGESGDGVITITEGVGSIVCAGNANSTGVGADLRACGSSVVADNDTTLTLANLPSNQTVLLVNSRETILVANPGGSQGDLCIGSLAMGRHVNDILNSGASGTASLALDLANVPTNLGRTAVLAGDTWYWQAWYRDVDGGGAPTSNFSSAICVTFN